MRFRATEVARAVQGDLLGGDVDIDGVAIDSRLVTGGELFVPIVAERDGHDFVEVAVRAGAVAYLTQRGRTVDAPAIEVDDTGRALLALGRHARSRLGESRLGDSSTPVPVVGITGSVGKTTVKDLTAAALSSKYTVHASPRSFNNELGVPLTLATAPADVGAVVVEMGARGRGHIAALCAIAQPTVGIVTTVALAHSEMFGTIEEVAAAKSELIEQLPPDGTAVLNADHPLVLEMAARTDARVLTFGVDRPGADVTASGIAVDDDLRAAFRLHSPWGGADVRLGVRGAHQVMNALAAATAAMVCGASPDDVAGALASAVLSPWRMDLQRAASGAAVLNDSYNANPTSMEAALRALAALPVSAHGRRVAVLGVMAELGADGPAEHLRIARLARELDVDVIAVDAPDYGAPVVSGIDGAIGALGALHEGDAVLVKGSRVAGLERLAHELLG